MFFLLGGEAWGVSHEPWSSIKFPLPNSKHANLEQVDNRAEVQAEEPNIGDPQRRRFSRKGDPLPQTRHLFLHPLTVVNSSL